MVKLLIGRPLPRAVLARAAAEFEVTVRENTAPMTSAEMKSSLVLYDAIMPSLGDLFSAEVFDEIENPRCKLLANFGVGFNHIDVAAAQARGVQVSNTPGAVTDATADIAMTLLLMSARRAGEGERLVRSGKWEGWHPVQMLGAHVTGKRLGILGMGRIGQAVARRGHFGFGMQVAYASRTQKALDFDAERVADAVALASQVDFLVVCLPGGAETRHSVNSEVLAAMAPTAHLINVARGDVVDEAALIAALEAGAIGGAGLDVYENEPEVPEALRRLENVTLLPHLGTASQEVREAMGMMVLDNVAAFAAGQRPPNLLLT